MGREPFNPYGLLALTVPIALAAIGSKPKANDFTSMLWIYTIVELLIVLCFYINLRIHYDKLAESFSTKNKAPEKPTTVQNYITINTSDGSYHTTGSKPKTKQNS